MSRLSRVFEKPESRMRAVLVMLAVIILASAGFLVFENKRNRETYLSMYQSGQYSYTEQLGYRLEQLLSEGAGEAEIASWLSEEAEVSANSWSFCARGDEILFAKDKKTTETLREDKDRDVFLKKINSQDAVVTMVRDKQEEYEIGTITAESYALTQGGVQQHEIYMILLFAILCMLAVMAVIGVTAKLNQVEKNLKSTSKAMKRQNIKLERTGEQKLSGEEAAPEPEQGGQEFYDSELIRMFLKKSDEDALMPMQILFARIVMERRYYARQEIFDALDKLKQFLRSSHVIGEIKKGCFVVLMYRTTKEDAAEIVRKYEESLREDASEHLTPMELSLTEVLDGQPALQIYEDFLKGKTERGNEA